MAAIGLAVAVAAVADSFRNLRRTAVKVKLPSTKLLINPANFDLASIVPDQGVVWISSVVENRSTAHQELRVVSKSCGCVDVLLPKSLAPSAIGLMWMSIDARKKLGYQRVLAQIAFDKEEPVDCTITYNALAPIAVVPDFVHVDDVGDIPSVVREISVLKRVERNQQMTPPDVVCERGDVHVRLLRTSDEMNPLAPFRHVQFHYEVCVPPVNAEIPIRFSDVGEEAVVYFRVRVRHHPFLNGPTNAVIDESGMKPQSIALWSRDGRTFEIDRLDTSDSQIGAVPLTTGKARIHRIQINARVQGGSEHRNAVVKVFIKGSDRPYILNVAINRLTSPP